LAGRPARSPKRRTLCNGPTAVDGFECATATVPLDYARPKAGTLDIAVTRMPATEPDERLGSLFVNFGGPGAPAVETLHTPGVIAAFASLNDRYDIVGVDPRGTSGTDAIDCKYTAPEQPFPRPATVDRAALIASYRSYIDQCLALNPRVLPYVSTANVARDMNSVRRALGEHKLNYLGYSYGTVLGAPLESMFPERVGRFVLDGAVDATWLNDPMRFNREQLRSSEMALARFFEACAANQEACSGFGGEDPEATFDDLVERLNATPIPAGAGNPRTVNGDDVLAVTFWTMYAKQYWPTLGEALALAAAGDGSLMRELADVFSGRREDGSGNPPFDRTFAIQSLERDVHAKLPLAERWGGGEVASIDGLRFVVPRRTIHAAYNRRYFDRRRGITLLGTTADHYAGLHTVVITGTQPDAPYILDGLLDPQTSVRPREIMTDTAGYTDVIFGLFRLLGYQYSPRLADAGGATFWRLNPTDYGPLNSLARHQVNTHLIEQHYDDLLRVAGSLLQRHTTASQLVRALRSHTRHLASLVRALQHVGRAAKTIHLLGYCNDQPFRRRILT
jgi:pimeloyl-ACP methyl ester carboxylesterase